MYVRSTQQLVVQSAIEFARRHSSRLVDLQQQISTGIRLHRPSEDPAAVRSLVTQQFVEQQFEVYLQNNSVARSQLNASVSELLAAKDLFLEARDIAFESRQTTDRTVFVAQIDRLIGRLEQLANSQFDGKYLYSGTATGTKPFTVNANDPRGRGVYHGSRERAEIAIDVFLTAEVRFAGHEVFQPIQRGTTVYLGNTGAAAGTGTDSAVGSGKLIVRHTSTIYAGGSGIAAGVSSVAGDTIMGPLGSHTLHIDDVAKTISLNQGATVSFVGTETDLQVQGPNGEKVHVDVTSLTAGFVGDVAVGATGTLSTDGGLTEVAIDYSNNQTVVNSQTGEITFVDSTAIRSAGNAYVEYTGTADAFGVLFELRQELLNPRNLSESEWQAAISRRLQDVDRIKDHLLDVVGQQSATLSNLDSVQSHSEDLQLETRRILSELQSADLPQAITELQQRQSLLQASYAMTASLFRTSLLEFLR